ncbi:MAG: type I-C CRISPR-associated endonuclease Cas1 [Bacteroidales bacterium]|nr:type I-C CRISPR-associated endonuclease Cas1 [Bacteroidales bacterium]
MRKLLNVLYVTTPESYLSKDGMNVVVSVDQEERFRIPFVNIEGIVTFGYKGASPGLMKLCADNGVSLSFLSPNGRFVGRFQGPVRGNVLLRKAQYQISDDKERALHYAQLFVAGKIQNYRTILQRFVRDNGDNLEVETAIKSLEVSKRWALSAKEVGSLIGVEGDAANTYFGIFPNLLIQKKEEFPFHGRNKRPPKDAVNALLSFVYTLLANETAAALETVGLDPYVGFMHALRPGRTSLALDLMEEMRAYLGDRLVLTLINRKQVAPNDFVMQGESGVVMTDNCRKTVLTAWQNRKKETIVHPYLEEKIPVGLLPYAQALLLARAIRGDIDDYPVFLIH